MLAGNPDIVLSKANINLQGVSEDIKDFIVSFTAPERTYELGSKNKRLKYKDSYVPVISNNSIKFSMPDFSRLEILLTDVVDITLVSDDGQVCNVEIPPRVNFDISYHEGAWTIKFFSKGRKIVVNGEQLKYAIKVLKLLTNPEGRQNYKYLDA